MPPFGGGALRPVVVCRLSPGTQWGTTPCRHRSEMRTRPCSTGASWQTGDDPSLGWHAAEAAPESPARPHGTASREMRQRAEGSSAGRDRAYPSGSRRFARCACARGGREGDRIPRATCAAMHAANAIGLFWTLLRTSGWAVDSDIAVGMCGAPGDVDPLNDGLRVVLPGSRRVPSGKGAVAKFFGVRMRVPTRTAWVRARSVL